MPEIKVRGGEAGDRSWLTELMERDFAGTVQVRREEAVDVNTCPYFIAEIDGERVGTAVYRVAGDECELVCLDAIVEGCGVGTALVEAVKLAARSCRRLWVSTTNNNLEALGFYQRRGFRLCALRPMAVDHGRARLKPAITREWNRIPVRDELELEMWLDSAGRPKAPR